MRNRTQVLQSLFDTSGCILLLATISVAAVSACTPERRPASTVQNDMVAVSRMLVTLDRLTADGDLEALLEYFSEDAVMMPPGEAALIGTRQIGDWHRALFETFDVDVSHEPLETDVFGDMIIHRGNVRGTLQPKTGAAPVAFDDKYLFVIRRDPDGSLEIWRAIANANPPGDG